jgi:hypothetical protein
VRRQTFVPQYPPPHLTVIGDLLVQIVPADALILPEPRVRVAIVDVVAPPSRLRHFAASLRAWTDRGAQ